MLEILRDLPLFALTIFGLGAPLAARLRGAPPIERLVWAAAGGVVAAYLFGFALYVSGAPWGAAWLLPAAGGAGLFLARGELRAWRSDEDTRATLWCWAGVLVWCLGLLALVRSYSGGGWAGDWHEHWERTLFFLQRGPLDQYFIGVYPLTARPPLANLVTTVFLALGEPSYARFQVFLCLLNALAFLPIALLARRFGAGARVIPLLALVVLCNPMFAQNTTFAWTKLVTAFFVLAAVAALLGELRNEGPQHLPLALAALAAGLLTHYSAAPWIIAIGVGWLAAAKSWRTPAAWRRLAVAALPAVALGAAWLAWSCWHYGLQGAFFANTTAAAFADTTLWRALSDAAAKLLFTLVPHPFHPAEAAVLAQENAVTYLRDWWFNIYQTTLPGSLGLAGLIAGFWVWRQNRPDPGDEAKVRTFFSWMLPIVLILGAASHPTVDTWGLNHICLQPLSLLLVAWLVARLAPLLEAAGHRIWSLLLGLAMVSDLFFGIVLHYAGQALALGAPLAETARHAAGYVAGLNPAAILNFHGKQRLGVAFLADGFGVPAAGIVAALGLLFLFMWRRAQPKTPATTVASWLGVLLLGSLFARWALVAQGGQYFFGDEPRYHRGIDLYLALADARWADARQLLALPEHAAFVWLGALLSPLHQLGAWFNGQSDWSDGAQIYASAGWAAALLAVFSTAIIWLTHRLALAAGADESAALAAALLAASSNTLFYFSRHLLPYDAALCAWLGGLLLTTRPGRRAQFFAGLLVGLTYHLYNGYWFLVPVGALWWWLRRKEAGVAPFGWAAGTITGLGGPLLIGTLAGGAAYWSTLRAFSGTVKQGLFAEGWSLPWEYLWHSEGWWGALVVAALAGAVFLHRANLPRHAVHALLCAAALYLLLVLVSTVAQNFVVYGRTARPLVPLLCLAAGWAVAHLTASRPGWRRPLTGAALSAAAVMFAPHFLRVFPRDFEQRVLADFGMTKRTLEFSGSLYRPLVLPVTRPDLLLVNAQFLYPLRERLPSPPGEALLALEHPLAYPPFQYEGHTPRERALLRAGPIEMKLARLADPSAWPDHLPMSLAFSPDDRPDGHDRGRR